MPRAGKTGTTRSKIIRKRTRGTKTARLRYGLRRAALRAAFLLAVLWLGAWAVTAGAPASFKNYVERKSMVLLADAGFRVDNILVEGRVHTDPAVLRALIDLQRGDPLFAFDPAQAQEMIGRLSWVRDVHVERRLPDTVYIGLIEREPIALWQHKGKLRVIDNEGVTITTELTAGMKGLPIVVGEEANKAAAELLALVAADPDLKGRLEAATWVGARRWDMSFAGGVTVRLPEGDLAPALSRLSDAQRRDRVLEEDIESIDLRQPDRMVLRPRAGAVRDYKASYTPI